MLKLLRKPGYPPGAVGRGKLLRPPLSPAWIWGSMAMAVVPWGPCDIWGPDADRWQLTRAGMQAVISGGVGERTGKRGEKLMLQ